MSRTETGLSNELGLLFRPEAGYRGRAKQATLRGWHWLRRPLFLLLTLASMISLLTAGRLTLPLLVDAVCAWSFVPALHIAAAAAAVRVLAGRRKPILEAIDLYFMSFGPWLLWMLILCGAPIFFPSGDALWKLHKSWFLGSAVVAFVWSAWINLGFFRGALELTFPRAVLAVLSVRALVWGFALTYFHVSDQLLPRLPWVTGQ